jgi:hypothetical protein
MVVFLFVGGLALLLDYLFTISQRDNGDIDIGAGVELLFAELLLLFATGMVTTLLVHGHLQRFLCVFPARRCT